MARTTTHDDYDVWIKITITRHNVAKMRQRAIALECEGNETLATKFMSLADCAEDACNYEQLRAAITR